MTSLTVFILAKNEAANIERCLGALASTGWPVVVLDSGSTDATSDIVARYPFVSLVAYAYVDHCRAYNDITTTLCSTEHALVLDADMVVGDLLQREISRAIAQTDCPDVLIAPIRMCVDGIPLRYASLCPPKYIVFKSGRPLFVSSGHGERLMEDVSRSTLSSPLLHDDRKGLAATLQSQARYADNLVKRARTGQITGRDRLRMSTPLLLLIVPLMSLVIRRGLLDGSAGWLYAIDRLIAEAIMYRQSVAERVAARRTRDEDAASPSTVGHSSA